MGHRGELVVGIAIRIVSYSDWACFVSSGKDGSNGVVDLNTYLEFYTDHPQKLERLERWPRRL